MDFLGVCSLTSSRSNAEDFPDGIRTARSVGEENAARQRMYCNAPKKDLQMQNKMPHGVFLTFTKPTLEFAPDFFPPAPVPNNFEHFTPHFFRPPHLRKDSLRKESAHASNSVSSSFEGRTNGHVQKLSQEQRFELMTLLHKVPSLAPVIAMMLDRTPDKGTTIENCDDEWSNLDRNQRCEVTNVKSKNCMCAACTEKFGVTGEKWDKAEKREQMATFFPRAQNNQE